MANADSLGINNARHEALEQSIRGSFLCSLCSRSWSLQCPCRRWNGSPQIRSSAGGPLIATVTAIYQKYLNHWLTLRCVYSCEIHLLAQLWQHYSSCFADSRNNAHIQIRWLLAALFMFTSHWHHEHVHSPALEQPVNEGNDRGQNLYGDFPTEFGHCSRICLIFIKSTEGVVSLRGL